jgi:hypothetical protein
MNDPYEALTARLALTAGFYAKRTRDDAKASAADPGHRLADPQRFLSLPFTAGSFGFPAL